MPRLVDTAFKAYCEEKRNSLHGIDLSIEGGTALQHYQIPFIYRHFGFVDIIEKRFSEPDLVVIASTKCNRLLKFIIRPDGLYTLHVIPVFGGNNSPFYHVFTKPKIENQSCLEI